MTPNKPRDINDVFAEYEAELEAKSRPQIDAEKAAWDALPQSEKDRIIAESEAALEAQRAAMIASGAMEDPDAPADEDEDEDEDGEDEA